MRLAVKSALSAQIETKSATEVPAHHKMAVDAACSGTQVKWLNELIKKRHKERTILQKALQKGRR